MLVPWNTAPPLVEFVYRTFGERFGGLVMAGYGEAVPSKKRSFLFVEYCGDVKIDWTIDVVSNQAPCGEEPLVFAALLKLMLNQMPIADIFYFKMADLLAELGWSNTPMRQEIVDCVIEKYITLTFRKREHRRRQRYKKEGAQWGRYKFVSGYIVDSIKESREAQLARTSSRIDLDRGFIKGLNKGRVTFADMDFGLLNFAD
jgi:hypothetical protein